MKIRNYIDIIHCTILDKGYDITIQRMMETLQINFMYIHKIKKKG